jgi:transcriptional regulator with XRE-family HTH domain
MEFRSRMRLIRVARGMSQRDLQELASIDTRYLSEIESGKILPNPEWEQRIREALGWTPDVDAALDALAAALGLANAAANGEAA